MRNFRELEVWNLGMNLAIKIYPITQSWPSIHQYRLTSQVLSSSSAIPSNIAEGCSRSSNKDFKRYLEYALGEAYETETHILIAFAYNLIKREDKEEIIDELFVLQRKISAFIKSL
jgi:four helix bundle protein